ncbi:MAG: hypothetical protein M3Z01_08160 [Thermoproteota archaeon]|nr:hypothetical protein [Thermoproteota archaeon]
MNFFKRILNKIESNTNSAKHDDSDAIFSLTSASISIEEKLGLQFSGAAGLCVKVIDGVVFKNSIKDCTDLLNVSKDEFKFDYRIFTDSYNYLWIIITGKDLTTNSDVITNVAAGISSEGDILEENGFAAQILAAVFKFKFLEKSIDLQNITQTTTASSFPDHKDKNEYDVIKDDEQNNKNSKENLYIIYNYKTNNFYPYIPSNNQQRDTTKELQTLSILKSLISVETDFSKWFPVKDIPF